MGRSAAIEHVEIVQSRPLDLAIEEERPPVVIWKQDFGRLLPLRPVPARETG